MKHLKNGTPQLLPTSYEFSGAKYVGDPENLADTDPNTGMIFSFPVTQPDDQANSDPLLLNETRFDAPQDLKSLDVRVASQQLPRFQEAKLRVYALEDGQWRTIYWGRLDSGGGYGGVGLNDSGLLVRVVPTRTDRVRVEIQHPGWKELKLGMLRLYGPVDD